jgi:hypothetical protein
MSESDANDPPWWDGYSNQPYKLSAEEKLEPGLPGLLEYATVGATALLLSPVLIGRYLTLKPVEQTVDPRRFIGLSVSPDQNYESAVLEMVEELGAEELLVRIPVWDLGNLDEYTRFIEKLNGKRVLVNVLQDRECVEKPWMWFDSLRQILRALSGKVEYIQLGNAINRRKWGCAHSGEYLDLLETAENLRIEFPEIKFVGSSVIDFEPLVTLRTLWNARRYSLDVVSSLLYVNRRGSPQSRQFGIFDLHNKLRLIYAMVLSGNRNARRLWITETNWPLLDTRPYTPNSGHPGRTVDEETQAAYLEQYYRIAYRTGWVERVFWWQLINPGYGLVDHRSGTLRKHPSYFALKKLLAGGLDDIPV